MKEALISWAKIESDSRRKKGRKFYRAARRETILRPTPRCRTTRGFGPRCNSASGGTWRGCVYDADRIIAALEAEKKAGGK